MSAKKAGLRGKQLADAIIAAAIDRKAGRITLVRMGNEAGIAEWFVVCETDNPAHNRAVADEILHQLKSTHTTAPWHTEGASEGRWILVDYSDVVVHVLLSELNEYYRLSELGEQARCVHDETGGSHE